MLPDHFIIVIVHPQAGFVGDGNESVFHDLLRRTDDHVVPPGDVHGMVFKDIEILRGGNAVHAGIGRDGAFGHMHGHGNAVTLRQVADPFVLKDAAGSQNIGMDDADSAGSQKRLESFGKENILTGADGHGGAVAQPFVLIGVLPGNHVFRPGNIVFFNAAAQPDAILHADMAEMIDGQGNVITDDAADIPNIFLQHIQPLFRHMNPRKRMGNVEQIVGPVFGLPRFIIDCAAAPGQALERVHFLHQAQRGAYCPGYVFQDPQAQIHFQEGEAFIHPGLQRPAHILAGVFASIFSAQHLVYRYAVGFAGQIPQGDLDTADAAALAGGTAELTDAAEQLFHVAGVFSQNPALQHFSVHPVAAVAYFTQADDALVGIDLHQGAVHGSTDHIRKAYVGDFQLTRGRTAVERAGQHVFIAFHYKGASFLRLPDDPVQLILAGHGRQFEDGFSVPGVQRRNPDDFACYRMLPDGHFQFLDVIQNVQIQGRRLGL